MGLSGEGGKAEAPLPEICVSISPPLLSRFRVSLLEACSPWFPLPELSLEEMMTRGCANQRMHRNRSFRAGLLIRGTMDSWGQSTLCLGRCPVHCRIFSNIPGIYTLDASSPHFPVVSRCWPTSLGDKNTMRTLFWRKPIK